MKKRLKNILNAIPAHVAAVQLLIDRAPEAEGRKEIIVSCGCAGAITPDEAHLLITANQLETA
jgi:hypothetical protein